MRPPLALLVEGRGEFEALPRLIRRGILGGHGAIEASRSQGTGDLVANLEDKLARLVQSAHPCAVIVTVDSADVRNDLRIANCAVACAELQERANRWLVTAALIPRLAPVPRAVTIVLQHPELEAWLLADPEGLADLFMKETGRPLPNVAVPAQIDMLDGGHDRILSSLVYGGYRKKQPEVARISKHLCPRRMVLRSRSFAKFWKEVLAAYSVWAGETDGVYGEII